jgi:hypothetical protein
MQKVKEQKFTKTEKKLLEYLKKKNDINVKPDNCAAQNFGVKSQTGK